MSNICLTHKISNNMIPEIFPVRPILDMSSCPQHNLAKWLIEVLEPIHKFYSKYVVKDTFSFVDRVKDLNIGSRKMISLDVSSLYPNVPIEETLNIIKTFIDEHDEFLMTSKQITDLIRLCCVDVPLSFKNQVFIQKDGII